MAKRVLSQCYQNLYIWDRINPVQMNQQQTTFKIIVSKEEIDIYEKFSFYHKNSKCFQKRSASACGGRVNENIQPEIKKAQHKFNENACIS